MDENKVIRPMDFVRLTNIVSRMVEKVLRDKMLDNIEIIVRNKDIND